VRTILFGEGTAQTTIPDDWHLKSTPRGVVTAAPKQNVAFLWLSTISWQMPEPDFSPASYALQTEEGKVGVRSEHHPDFVILYSAGEGDEKGMKLDVHQFKIAPKRAVNGRCAMAFVTLSVKREGKDLPVARESLDAAWAAARGVAFNYD
jgi:hypothetical protein